MALFRQPLHGERGRRCQPTAMSPHPVRHRAGADDAALCALATAPQPSCPMMYEYACSSLSSPATASPDRPQLNGAEFPACATAEGRQFNGALSLRILALLRLPGGIIVGVMPDEKRCLAVACRVMHVVVNNAVHREATAQLHA